LLSAGVLGIWGHHATVTDICLDALASGHKLDPMVRDNLEAELFANALTDASSTRMTLARARHYLADPGTSNRWRVHAALATCSRPDPPATR
jgi:hypothetical protein